MASASRWPLDDTTNWNACARRTAGHATAAPTLAVPTSAPFRSRWRWWARQASCPVGKLVLSFLFWMSLSVVADRLFEQPGSSKWQQGLALGGGVFALLMVVLSAQECARAKYRY